MSGAYLRLENLGKRFAREQVLSGVNLSLARGETVTVFGPSGSGKTVLLRLIAGVLSPDNGRVTIDGEDVTAWPPEQRDVGMAFQTFALYPHLAAFDNIASPLRARRLAAAEVKRKVGTVAELLRIGHVLDHRPAQLSNGQKQRTALARALVGGPGVLLLDDPLRNVDAKLRYEMRLELPRVLREFRSAVLYVTQDYREAMALGDRIGVLYDGGFRQLAEPEAVYRRPASVQVARLFGDPPINLLPVRLDPGGHDLTTLRLGEGDGLTVTVPAGALGVDPALLAERDCLLGVRPEDLHIDAEADDGTLTLELDAVTPLNLRKVLLLKTAGGDELLASIPDRAALPAGLDGRRHRHVGGRIDWRRAVWFDAASGAALG